MVQPAEADVRPRRAGSDGVTVVPAPGECVHSNSPAVSSSGSGNMVLDPAASALDGILFKMHIPRPGPALLSLKLELSCSHLGDYM